MTNSDAFVNTLTTNLGCSAGEQLAIVTDTTPFREPTDELPDRVALARRLSQAAETVGMHAVVITYPPSGRSGIEPPESVYEAVYPSGFTEFCKTEGLLEPLLEKTIDDAGLAKIREFLQDSNSRFQALLVISGYSITHTRFRKLVSDTGLMRAATMPGVEPFMFSGIMTADWDGVARRSQAVAKLLSAAASVEIESAGGRILEFSLEGRSGLADTGLLNTPGAFGNLPGGEAFIAPLEGSASGQLSVGPRENPDAWAFEFEGGNCKAIIGDPPWREKLEQTFLEHPQARNLAELGVGTNEKAERPDNTLEAEKILGTVHLALGDNFSFGGKVSVPYHQDFIVYGPSLRLIMGDGSVEEVLQAGKFLVEPGKE